MAKKKRRPSNTTGKSEVTSTTTQSRGGEMPHSDANSNETHEKFSKDLINYKDSNDHQLKESLKNYIKAHFSDIKTLGNLSIHNLKLFHFLCADGQLNALEIIIETYNEMAANNQLALLLNSTMKINDMNYTPLEWTAKCSGKKNETIVQLLIQHGAEVKEDLFIDGCKNNHFVIVKHLFDRCSSSGIKKLANIKFDTGNTILHYALANTPISESALEVIKLLIANGANIFTPNSKGEIPLLLAEKIGDANLSKILAIDDQRRTALHYVCASPNNDQVNDVLALEKLLRNYQDKPTIVDCEGKSPLFLACEHGNYKKAELLIKHGADIYQVVQPDRNKVTESEVDGYLPTPLSITWSKLKENSTEKDALLKILGTMVGQNKEKAFLYACKVGMQDLAEWIISYKKKININCKNENGETPLYLACKYNQKHIVDFLLDKKADFNVITNNKHAPTPFAIACVKNNATIVLSLIDKGYQLTEDDILTLCRDENLNTLKILIDNNKIKNLGSKFKEATLLWHALKNKQLAVATYLLSIAQCPNPDVMNSKERTTPLNLAAEIGDSKIIELLLNKNASYKKLNHSGMMAVHLAAAQGESHDKVIDALIAPYKRGSDKEDISYLNQALFIACVNGQLNLMQILIANGASLNHTNDKGEDLMHVACSTGHLEILKWLHANGLDINCADDLSGETPLYAACRAGHVQVADYLLNNGAKPNDPHIQNGNAPLYVACEKGHTEVVAVLLQHKADPNQGNRDNEALKPILVAKNNQIKAELAKFGVVTETKPSIYQGTMTTFGFESKSNSEKPEKKNRSSHPKKLKPESPPQLSSYEQKVQEIIHKNDEEKKDKYKRNIVWADGILHFKDTDTTHSNVKIFKDGINKFFYCPEYLRVRISETKKPEAFSTILESPGSALLDSPNNGVAKLKGEDFEEELQFVLIDVETNKQFSFKSKLEHETRVIGETARFLCCEIPSMSNKENEQGTLIMCFEFNPEGFHGLDDKKRYLASIKNRGVNYIYIGTPEQVDKYIRNLQESVDIQRVESIKRP